jgi:threonylcarbamoyladenosine tRNA methylthiotransferase MtaB
MAEFLRRRGHTVLTADEADCDAVVVNTCTVTGTADKKSRNAIRRMRKRYPDALLAVCGCLPQTEELTGINGIDLVGGTSNRAAFLAALEEHVSANLTATLPEDFEDTLPDARPLGRSRAYIRIQEGCDNRCTYCKVPAARGRARSRPSKSVLDAVRRAVEDGAVEIILTGTEIGSYRPSLPILTQAVCRAAAPVPVRLSSIDPRHAGGELVGALKGEPNFRPAFHLSLQSCCDKTLAAMGRRYTAADIASAFALLRESWNGAVITADIIVGFPGETDDDFHETLGTLKELRPEGLHIFPYSRRAGTPAAELPGQLTRAVKEARAKALSAAFPKVSP